MTDMDDPAVLAGFVLALLGAVSLVAAALHDLAARTVPNRMALGVAACGLGLAILEHRVPTSLLAASIVLGGSLPLWLRGLLGGGDAKLLAAAVLLAPAASAPWLLLNTAVAGGALCLPYALGPLIFAAPAPAGRAAGLLRRSWRCERRRLARRGPLPYAVAIAAGALFTLVGG